MKFPAEKRRGFRRGALSACWLVVLCSASLSAALGGPLREPVTELTSAQTRAYAEVLNMRPAAARALLGSGQDAGTLLVQDCLSITELLVSQDAALFESTVKAQDQRLTAVENQTGPLAEYAAAEIRLHQAAAQVVFGQEVRGAWSLRQSYGAMQRVTERYPHYLPARKTLGMLQFFIGSLPEGYRWFLRLLGLPGSVEAGLANLRRAASQPNDFQLEARLVLALLEETYYKKPEAALKLVETLHREQPESQLLTFVLISQRKKQHRTDEALAAYRARPTGAAYLPLPYLHHLAADLLLYQGQYPAARRENELFLHQYRGRHYLKDAYFKLYLACWLGGDAPAAARYRARIGPAGRTVLEEDNYAQRFFDDPQPLDATLTRARLQIDGGYYRPALATLATFRASTATPLRNQLEHLYRRARALHLLGQPDSARRLYTQTIARAGLAPYYYAPQSALQLGYLYQLEGQKSTAKAYFQKVLSYPKHEYKNSTDTKAKLALVELK